MGALVLYDRSSVYQSLLPVHHEPDSDTLAESTLRRVETGRLETREKTNDDSPRRTLVCSRQTTLPPISTRTDRRHKWPFSITSGIAWMMHFEFDLLACSLPGPPPQVHSLFFC